MKIFKVYLGRRGGVGNIEGKTRQFLRNVEGESIYTLIVGRQFKSPRMASIKKISLKDIIKDAELNSIKENNLFFYIKPHIYVFGEYGGKPFSSPSNYEIFSRLLGFKAEDYYVFKSSLNISDIIDGVGINKNDSLDAARLKLILFSEKNKDLKQN